MNENEMNNPIENQNEIQENNLTSPTEQVEETVAQQTAPDFACSPPPSAPMPAKEKRSHLLPILICFTIIIASISATFCVAMYGNGVGFSRPKTTVIYQKGEWENEGELISNEAIVNATAKTSPSVVAIMTESVSFNSYLGNYVSEGAGSGVICTEDGYIITNHHVIDGATNIRVTLENGDTFGAELIGSDAQTDLAVIKIEANGLVPAIYAQEGSLRVGQTVVAIGNPLGTLSNTVTSGVVSALARQITISGTEMTLLQHNASVSPGNSGGGLFNINGELVGIVNAKSSGEGVEGVGFAIPVETYKKVVQELIEYGHVTGRPQIGINAYEVLTSQALYSLPDEIRACVRGINSYGVYIGGDANVQYVKDSPKLLPGDYVASVDDQLINEFADFAKILADKAVGDTIKITVYRYDTKSERTSQITASIVLTEKKS